MRKGDSLPVIPEESWENECYIDSLSAWYDTKYYSQRLIEKYKGRRQILLPIKDPEPQIDISDNEEKYFISKGFLGKNSTSTLNLPPILKNRSKRSGNEIKTVPPQICGCFIAKITVHKSSFDHKSEDAQFLYFS